MSMKIFYNLEVNIKNIINLSQSLEREIDLIKNMVLIKMVKKIII